jgi:hypothetical protein
MKLVKNQFRHVLVSAEGVTPVRYREFNGDQFVGQFVDYRSFEDFVKSRKDDGFALDNSGSRLDNGLGPL